jgi:hypothetical protein
MPHPQGVPPQRPRNHCEVLPSEEDDGDDYEELRIRVYTGEEAGKGNVLETGMTILQKRETPTSSSSTKRPVAGGTVSESVEPSQCPT